ncbi:pilus assembly protein TadG-related protein, partial [Mesorhizobium sp. M1148]|uniref:pilus assembly protein TadG-related protein n=1 Tax=unclassified Mesorhizobium TaxID=325217 RepID=UPI0033361A39
MGSSAFIRFWPALVRATRARNGNVAVVVAFTLPVVVGGAGLGMETSFWYYSSLKLQAVADAAAY